jgi:hypothetical protein
MSETKVVHCKKDKYDVYIGRGSKWGNPYRLFPAMGDDAKRRTEVIEAYRRYILAKPELLAALLELKGKTLGCWCKPKRCHGDVLVELINNTESGISNML